MMIRQGSTTRGVGTSRRPTGALRLRASLFFGLLLLPFVGLQAAVLEEVRELQRQLDYEDAVSLLESELETLVDEERAQGLLLLAELTTDHKEVRRLLREAYRSSEAFETRRATDLALAELDYARGNYNSVRTRLRNYENDAAASLLIARAFVALGDARAVLRSLRQAGDEPTSQLLRGWAERESGNPQEARAIFELLLSRPDVDARPTALLWKAECEARLDLQQEALATAAELQETYPDSPEAILVESTVASVRRSFPDPDVGETPSGGVLLQIGAFEDRANALRFRDGLPRHIGPVSVDEVRQGMRRLYRVHIGPFETVELAQAYGRKYLNPIDVDWRLGTPEQQ